MDIMSVLHNLLRWLILLFGVFTVISAISGLSSKRNYSNLDGKSNFFFMLGMDIQILLGFILYFNGIWFDQLKNFGATMKDAQLRFFSLEHVLLMLIAWVLVHAGRISVKKASTSQAKYKKTLIYFGIALLLILLAIPWPFRVDIARPLFKWF
jgi:formate hydrogenlyase subunit 4